MDAVELILAKRNGRSLSDAQIRWFIEAYTKGVGVSDEQAAAMLMGIYFQGLDDVELTAWTRAMIDSGERLDLSGIGRPSVDKHSTGGVGDKVSLILCPLLAACGAAVPQLSGRGLGHTGGTLDKLEAIPGFRVDLNPHEWRTQLASIGCVISAAGTGLAPADRKLYALRDVTGTVESIPLIASSIMSKKIAEGTESLILDVKFGTGAFMQDYDQARRLAETMVGIGQRNGVRTAAVLTDMSTPLGRAAGNAIEVAESVALMDGSVALSGGPLDDLAEVTLALADEACRLARLTADPRAELARGGALRVWREMLQAQGADPDAPLPEAPVCHEVRAQRSGYVQSLEARAVGIAAWRLGAGRARKEDPVSPVAGVLCRRKPGEAVEAGEVVLELHADRDDRLPRALEALDGAIRIGDEQPAPVARVREVIR